MKMVVAIVRPEKVNTVLEALFRVQVRGLTISRVQGHGGETEHVENYRGTTVKMALSEKVRLEIGVSDGFVETTVNAIIEAARTGEVGDGKIFVMPVESVIRIRTNERDTDAVTPVAAGRAIAAANAGMRTCCECWNVERQRFDIPAFGIAALIRVVNAPAFTTRCMACPASTSDRNRCGRCRRLAPRWDCSRRVPRESPATWTPTA